ncbi:uncharacterized protein PV09_00037 [Verruconis gallopava]|uniref:Uncharacterized protein n=1 Tax=Verruconis gallopava TaxID=253628 RepID=A0A0D1Z821_9PEZI|nr:uncharacterized protein PV09_00037 [Verruconis gallopava]KIW09092.1 hypothetical protein PV09_00037 [Verruconis gallopava]
MSKEVPSFSSAKYWDKRFQDNPQSFEWLLPESCFDEELDAFRKHDGDHDHHDGDDCVTSTRPVLHIGPGTSMLSFHLKTFMGPRYVIHNVDFSQESVDWGERKEKEVDQADETRSQLPTMRWSRVSLLSLSSLLSVARPRSVRLIVDKSTSDAIACGLDVRINISPSSDVRVGTSSSKDGSAVRTTKVHPLHILALNLAVISAPEARWISLSYSKERYPFLPTLFAPFPDPLPDGFPDPNRYWKLRRQKEIQTEQKIPENFRDTFAFVHRPVTSHYMYVLERTEEELAVAVVEKLNAQAEER